MTFTNLKNEYERHHPDGHFFDRDTLKFFGERESEMRVLKDLVSLTDIGGEKHICYILSSRQRPPYGKPRRKYHYFDTNTFEHVVI